MKKERPKTDIIEKLLALVDKLEKQYKARIRFNIDKITFK